MRSWVMGRGVETFSISSAIAFASYTPTQMGSTVLPLMSLRMTMGILVTGSIISPRIFISTSIFCGPPPILITPRITLAPLLGSVSRWQTRYRGEKPIPAPGSAAGGKPGTVTLIPAKCAGNRVAVPVCCALAYQRVGAGAGDANGKVLARQIVSIGIGVREVEGPVAGGAPNPLAQGLIPAFHQHFQDAADELSVAPDLNGALPLLENQQAALLLFVRDAVRHVQRGGIGPRRVFEAEEGIVLDLIQQVEGLLEIGIGLAGEADDDIGGEGITALRILDPLDAPHVFVAGVEAVHGGEHARGARLHGQVDVIADGGVGVHGIDDAAHEIARMAGGVAHAAHAGDFGDAPEQGGEVPCGG